MKSIIKNTGKFLSEALVGIVVLFIFSQAFRMIWQLFLDAEAFTEYIATIVITLFLMFLMVMTTGLMLEAKRQSK